MSDEKPNLGERYSTAISTSNMRVDVDRSTPADLVIAAGMNQHRLGMALRRLQTEWDAAAKPTRPTAQAIKALAASYARIPSTGLVDVEGVFYTPEQAAHRDADLWHAHELGILFQRLKTLPEVRAGLGHWANNKGLDNPEHAVGSVLQWWLAPVCPACHGAKKRVIPGTGRTSSKDCPACRGAGERNLPHGAAGRMVLGYIRNAMNCAGVDMKRRFNQQKLREAA